MPGRRVQAQVVRTVTMADAEIRPHVVICDRDAKWSAAVRTQLRHAGIRVVCAPYQAPNANAYAERVVRSIKDECLDGLIPLGEGHLRHAISEYVAHYHRERNHQELDNRLIVERSTNRPTGRLRRCPRLGGLLSVYERAA